jgi:hypothetical protein
MVLTQETKPPTKRILLITNMTIVPNGQHEGHQRFMCFYSSHVEQVQCVGGEDCGECVKPSVLFVLFVLANILLESQVK